MKWNDGVEHVELRPEQALGGPSQVSMASRWLLTSQNVAQFEDADAA